MDRILIRSALVRVFFVVLLVLVAASAHASGPSLTATPPMDPRTVPETWVAGGLYIPSMNDHAITWRAHWVLTPEAAADVAGGALRRVRFAVPLGEGETVEPTFGVTPFTEGGHVAGIIVDRAGLDDRTVRAIVHEAPSPALGFGARLGAPVASGSALQIVDADLGGGTRLEVEPGTLLERRVGYLVAPGVSHAAREEARRLTAYDAHLSGAAVYVRGDDVKAAQGLHATIVTARARSRRGSIGIAVIFGAIVLALFAAVRRLRHAAGIERADAVLAAEVDALDSRTFNADSPTR